MTEALFAKMGRRLTGTFETCSECGTRFEKSRVNQKACSPVCKNRRRARFGRINLKQSHVSDGRGRPQHRGEAAPALRVACEQLEALLIPANRREWPTIIASWKTAPAAGYRDLPRLARSCVAAKLKLGVENG